MASVGRDDGGFNQHWDSGEEECRELFRILTWQTGRPRAGEEAPVTSGWDSGEMPRGVLRSAPGLALRPPISTWQPGWMIQRGFF